MATETIKAVITANEEKGIEAASASVDYTFPDTVEEFVELMGEEVVFNNLKQQVKIKLQAGMRSATKAGKSADELQAWADGWRPGLARPKKSAVDKAITAAEGMTEEELQKFLAEIQARRNA